MMWSPNWMDDKYGCSGSEDIEKTKDDSAIDGGTTQDATSVDTNTLSFFTSYCLRLVLDLMYLLIKMYILSSFTFYFKHEFWYKLLWA